MSEKKDIRADGAIDSVGLSSLVTEAAEELTTPELIDGAELLTELVQFLGRYVVLPNEAAADAVALFVLHTHAIDAAESTPRLAVLSPEKRSGKTRLFEVLATLVRAPLLTANISTPALFRSIELEAPTVLFDEADTIFGPAAKGKDSEDLRGVLNAGYRRGNTVRRCVGQGSDQWPQEFNVFCPVALAAIGDLPTTVMDRSIVIKMQRRLPHQAVEAWRRRSCEPAAARLRTAVEEWADSVMGLLHGSEPEMPFELTDRAAEIWEPLLAVADAAGGEWPSRARRAAVRLSAAGASVDVTEGELLLGDIRTMFEAHTEDWIGSQRLVEALRRLEDSPWGGGGLRALGVHELAKRLRPFEIRPKDIHRDGKVKKGYRRADFEDMWARYLSPIVGPGTATPATSTVGCGHEVADVAEQAMPPIRKDSSAKDESNAVRSGGLAQDPWHTDLEETIRLLDRNIAERDEENRLAMEERERGIRAYQESVAVNASPAAVVLDDLEEAWSEMRFDTWAG